MTINDATRKLVRERANYLCEYCHSSEEASAALFAIDHIVPQSLPGSSDEPDNLALACQRCNGYRYNFTTGIDPETKNKIALFNPRQQNWSDHFIWSADGLTIIGTTPTGRATCNRLDLNDERLLGKFYCKSTSALDQRWLASTSRRPTTRRRLNQSKYRKITVSISKYIYLQFSKIETIYM